MRAADKAFSGSRLFLPDFVARNRGRVLNVSSTASLMPGPLQAVYYATKAYVTSFSQAVAEELSDTNVTVTVLMPKATRTQFAKASSSKASWLTPKSSRDRAMPACWPATWWCMAACRCRSASRWRSCRWPRRGW